MQSTSFPSLPLAHDSVPNLRERLIHLRKQLEGACREIDHQIALLEPLDCHSSKLWSDAPKNLAESAEATTRSDYPSAGTFELTEQLLKGLPEQGSGEVILQPSFPDEIDPDLEQATLEELNAALCQAFTQMAARRAW